MNEHKDKIGRFASVYFNEEKDLILKNNFQVKPKKELMELLDVPRISLNRRIRELGLKYNDMSINNFKQCTKCKKVLPRTEEYFGTNKDGNSRLFRSACKECSKWFDLKRRGTIEGYIKGLLSSKKNDKRKFYGEYELTFEYIYELYKKQNGKCVLTGIEMTHERGTGFNLYNASIDRINPKIGYTKSNVQLVCLWANVSKNSLPLDDFRRFIELTYHKFNKNHQYAEN